MFTEEKVTEIFCIFDELYKNLDKELLKTCFYPQPAFKENEKAAR